MIEKKWQEQIKSKIANPTCQDNGIKMDVVVVFYSIHLYTTFAHYIIFLF